MYMSKSRSTLDMSQLSSRAPLRISHLWHRTIKKGATANWKPECQAEGVECNEETTLYIKCSNSY